jgi:hypothetical protein
LIDHELAQLAISVWVPYLQEAGSFSGKKTSFTRPESAREEFASGLLVHSGEVLSAIDQMHFARDLLSGYRKNLAKELSRYDYLVYGVENFCVRFVMVYDRSLKLVNYVYDLGLPARECKESTIVRNTHVRGTSVAVTLKELEKSTRRYREDRNLIIHSKTYHDEALGPIGTYARATSRGSAPELLRFRHYYKSLGDQYVWEKKEEFLDAISKVESIVERLFSALLIKVRQKIDEADA